MMPIPEMVEVLPREGRLAAEEASVELAPASRPAFGHDRRRRPGHPPRHVGGASGLPPCAVWIREASFGDPDGERMM